MTGLRVVGDRLYLPAAVDGVAVEALIDSAAETSIVDAAFAARLGIGGGEPVTARGTGAATAAATLVGGVTIDVAGLRLRPREVGVIDLAGIARRLGRGPLSLVLGRELFDAARLSDRHRRRDPRRRGAQRDPARRPPAARPRGAGSRRCR